jgi:hypothetical protein
LKEIQTARYAVNKSILVKKAIAVGTESAHGARKHWRRKGLNELLKPLMQEYQRLIDLEAQYQEWKKQNPDKSAWHYKGQRVSKARFERIGVMIRQSMIDFERSQSFY